MPINLSDFLGSSFTGLQGSQGLQGIQGTQSVQGTQGLQGTQGIQGVQGLSNQGVQGIIGPTGAAGAVSILNDTTNALRYIGFSSVTTGNANEIRVLNSGLVVNPSTASVGIGTTNPTYPLTVTDTGTPALAGLSNCIIDTTASIDGYIQNNIRNASTGTNASSDLIITSDNGTDTTNFVDLGINGSNYSVGTWTVNGANDGYLYASDGDLSIGIVASAASNYLSFFTGGTLLANERMRITGVGSVGIGSNAPSALLNIAGGTASANTASLKINSATALLTTPEVGAIEYDGSVFYATPSTNYGRGSIPITIYTSGTGTTLTQNQETTNTTLFPAANDTITLPVGTYFVRWNVHVTRGASTTSASLRVRFGGGATSTFSGTATGSATNAANAQNFNFNAVANGTDMTITPASTTSGGTYVSTIVGILRVTVQGTIVPGYSLSALLNVTGAALPASNSLVLQQITTSGSAAATGGWA